MAVRPLGGFLRLGTRTEVNPTRNATALPVSEGDDGAYAPRPSSMRYPKVYPVGQGQVRSGEAVRSWGFPAMSNC